MVLLTISLLFLSQLAAARRDSPQQVQEAAVRIMSVADAVLANHVLAPTRQQMVLEACRGMQQIRPGSQADKRTQVKGLTGFQHLTEFHNLARRISEMSTTPELQATVEQQLQKTLDRHNVPLSNHSVTAIIRNMLVQTGATFVTAEEDRVNQQLGDNRYVGIGIALEMQDQYPVMTQVFPNGPAARVGAQEKDLILRVDDRETLGAALGEIVGWLRGPQDTQVTCLLRQPDETEAREYTMTRGVVPIASIEPAKYSSDGTVASIKVTRIVASTVHELRQCLDQFPATIQALALDFRQLQDRNLHHALLLANALVDGAPLGRVQATEGERPHTAEAGTLCGKLTFFIAVDQSTAGTPEWIAAAVQDQKQGVIVGAPSAGSGLVFESVKVDEEMLVVVPTGILLRSNGQPLLIPRATVPRATVTAAHAARRASSVFAESRKRVVELPGDAAATGSSIRLATGGSSGMDC